MSEYKSLDMALGDYLLLPLEERTGLRLRHCRKNKEWLEKASYESGTVWLMFGATSGKIYDQGERYNIPLGVTANNKLHKLYIERGEPVFIWVRPPIIEDTSLQVQ